MSTESRRIIERRMPGIEPLVLPQHEILLRSLPIELIKSPVEREALILQKLNALVQHAKRTPYWRDKLPDGPLEDMNQLTGLPITTKNDLLSNNSEPFNSPMQIPGTNGIQAYFTSSTSGIPVLSFRAHEELAPQFERVSRFMRYAVPDIDTAFFINLLEYGKMWPGGISWHQTFQKGGINFLPMGDVDISGRDGEANYRKLIRVWQLMKPNSAFAFPSWLVNLAQKVEEHGDTELISKLRQIFYIGETFTGPAERYVRGRILEPGATVHSFFASTEIGAIAFQTCPDSVKDKFLHLIPDAVIAEVVDRNTYEPLPMGETGRLLLTGMNYLYAPIIRYDTGDLAVIHPEGCPCGLHTNLLELKGRTGDMVKLSAATFFDFRTIMNEVSAKMEARAGIHLPIYQVVITQIGPIPTVTVRVEVSDKDLQAAASLLSSEEIVEEMIHYTDNVGLGADFIKEKVDIVVEVLRENTLERIGAAGKIKVVDDQRK